MAIQFHGSVRGIETAMNGKETDSFPLYALITAAKNEAPHIELTMQSVIAQECKPICWVIVNDGSTDATEAIVSKYLREAKFIHLISNLPRDKRDFGAKARALKQALDYLTKNNAACKYLGTLDADISFKPDYYKCLIRRMESESNYGITSGVCYESENGQWVYDHPNPEWCCGGQAQVFRSHLYNEFGGYPELPLGGEDTVLEYLVREKGYNVRAFTDCIFHHHKKTSFSGNKGLRDYFLQGKQSYLWGSRFIYELIKSAARARRKPYLLSGIWRLLGYVGGAIEYRKPSIPAQQVRIVRKQQLHRLLRLIFGIGNKRL